MLEIKIDIGDFVQEVNLFEEEANSLAEATLSGLVRGFQKELRDLASKELHQTRQAYLRGIYSESAGPGCVVVGLKGFLPNAVEQGLSAFDEKEGFQKSKNKTSVQRKEKDGSTTNGWYLTIPLRWATPGAIGDSEGFANIMPIDVYKIAKKLTQESSLSSSNLPLELQVLKSRPAVDLWSGDSMSQYEHKSTLYEGMVKSQMENHGGYTTFRRVSDRSDSNAWINTGIVSRDFMGRSLQNLDVERIVSNEKNKLLNSL